MDDPWPRPYLLGPLSCALRLFAAADDVRAEYIELGTAFTESIDAKEGTTTGILPRIERERYWPPWTLPHARMTWRAPATYFRCARAKAAFWCVPGRPKRGPTGSPRRAHPRRSDLRNHE